MLTTNSYFEGKVMSIGLDNKEGHSTVGVMEAGDYTFGTSTVEYMTVVSGAMKVLLPGETRVENLYQRRNLHRGQRPEVFSGAGRAKRLSLQV